MRGEKGGGTLSRGPEQLAAFEWLLTHLQAKVELGAFDALDA